MSNMPDVIVLCGGAGLRLRSVVPDSPKAMARIGDRPFLELLLEKLDRSGFRRVILATGYKGEVIRAFFGCRYGNLALLYSREPTPLGTAGALRNAADLVTSDAVVVTNGDTYTDADLAQFVIDFHHGTADVSLLVVPADGRTDGGTVMIGEDRMSTAFTEKRSVPAEHYINAGIYGLLRKRLYDIPLDLAISLEHDLLPSWINSGVSVRAFIHQGTCLDIGTPERYQHANALLQQAVEDSDKQEAAWRLKQI